MTYQYNYSFLSEWMKANKKNIHRLYITGNRHKVKQQFAHVGTRNVRNARYRTFAILQYVQSSNFSFHLQYW